MMPSRGMGAVNPAKLQRNKTKPRRDSTDFTEYAEGGMAKNWIAGAIKHPGALRAKLGVKEGQTIPAKKLSAAAKKSGTLGRQARLAQTLKGFKK